ncbi:tRNA pseudouridine synthase B [Monoraphidium neglectum]|uniref:tRNA pseudouridine(55) synthase n=1 Tax=Monoraphidium neglectum TaxID=145388 RepID=A0A0D2K2C9_9CHLO|nr:tRNA pseudouridine synthase B [Monoraphidium neglectum]KIZ04698.1 tRNA pseudouridine synthase B [Monoraphidium neglectum]|eukprot:XP_013903717.1 tRNA pseudouridine synthase B [Monoraphidium neglectum]
MSKREAEAAGLDEEAGRAVRPKAAAAAAEAAAADTAAGDDDLDALDKQQQQQQQPAGTAAPPKAAASPPRPPPGASGRAPPVRIVRPSLPSDLVAAFSNAVMLVDKPLGWTSFDACNALKAALRRLGISKIGHAGTLDPQATGLLIICSGKGVTP